eukprot:16428759-Heterocapsa_arctica.AAC.1
MSPNCCGVRVSSGSPRRGRAGCARFFPAAQSRQNALKADVCRDALCSEPAHEAVLHSRSAAVCGH